MLWKITVQQGDNANGFGAGESLGSPLLICTSVYRSVSLTVWQLTFFVLKLIKSPLFPQKVIATQLCHWSPPPHSCWHTQAELLTDVSDVHCFCSEAGGEQGISRGCCCSWLTIPLPSSITILTDRACCHLYPWNKIVTLNHSNKMMKVQYKRNSCQWL